MFNSNTIYSTMNATRGIVRPNEATRKDSGFLRILKKVFGDLDWYGYVWYTTFFLAGAACFVVFKFNWILLATVLSLYVYLFASNLTARGLVAGLYVGIVSSLAYTVMCVITGVWGEVIANCALYIPLSVLAVFKWKNLKSANDNHEKTLAVTSIGLSEWWFYLSFMLAGTIGLGLFLSKVLHQGTAYVNAATIFLYIAGAFARNNGKREVWLFYIVGDITGIVLWLLVAMQGDWSTFPFCLSSISSFFNSIIGMIEWTRLYKKNQETRGIYLATQRRKVTKVIKVKRKFRNLSWTLATDECWQKRNKDFSKIFPHHTEE